MLCVCVSGFLPAGISVLLFSFSPCCPRHQNSTVHEKCNITRVMCVFVLLCACGSLKCASSVCYVWQCTCVVGCRGVCAFGYVRKCVFMAVVYSV